jgi:hypothetical protein
MVSSEKRTCKLFGVVAHPLQPRQHPLADTGLTAVALYDYQAGDSDEISFEPDDVITNIEMVCGRFALEAFIHA